MAALMNRVIGHEHQKQMLTQAQLGESLPHAMVFAGPQGIGKQKLARALAQNLVCENFRSAQGENFNGEACGICGSCIRVEKNQSENLKVLAPQNSAQIKIEQVREILDFLSFASDGKSRVIIIDQAQALNPQASNALLKTLEEPSANVFFILITTDVRLLMPTIRSRSQVLLFKSLNLEQLHQIKPALPEWVYKSARGQAGKLNEFSDGEAFDKRNSDLQFFENFWCNEKFLLETEIKEFAKDRATALSILKNWSVFTRDLILFSQGEKDQVMNSDQLATLHNLKFIASDKLYDFFSALLQALNDVDKLDITLLFESLWVKYARAS